MRYLVTGGCGFIGSHLVDALLAAGSEVRVLDDLSTGVREVLADGAELLVGDVADPDLVRRATAGIDGCFHLAAIASVVRCNEAWQDSHRTNLSATVGLFEAACRGARGFPVVYASSAAVYGDNPDLPLRESSPHRPRSPYGADKAGCELHAEAGAAALGLRAAGMRFFNVYGPRQRPDNPYSGVISVFAGRIARGQSLTIHGDGEQVRDFVYVADVARALILAMRRLEAQKAGAAEVYNVCSGAPTSIRELAERIMQLSGRTVPILHGETRSGDIRRSIGSPDRLETALGFRPRTALVDGLRPTVAWIGAA